MRIPTIDDRDIISNQNKRHAPAGAGRALATAVLALAGLLALWLLITTLDPQARAASEVAQWRSQQLDNDLYTVDMLAGALLRLALPIALAVGALGLVIVGLLLFYRRWATPVAIAAHYHVKALEAQRYQLPHTLTYAPRIDSRMNNEAASRGLLPELSVASLPGITDLAQVQHTPTPQRILLGLGPGDEHIVVPLARLWHVATSGPTGNGKSNIHRLLLAQLLALGAHVAIGDPKFTEYDIEQDEDWRPIARRLHLAPAVSADQIGALLDYAVEELKRRLERRRKQEKVGAPLFIALDELPWIYDHVQAADEQIAELVRMGRGVGVFTLAAAQDFLVKSTGLSAARDNFRSAFYLGGDLKTGSVLLDVPQRDLARREGELSFGTALLRSSATTPPALVRVPYVSNASLYHLLGDMADARHTPGRGMADASGMYGPREHQPHMPPIGQENAKDIQASSASGQAEPASAEARRLARLFLEGKDPAVIVAELRGIKSNEGKRYQIALAEVLGLIRQGLDITY